VRLATATVVERRPLSGRHVLLWLSAPEVSAGARPGQFLMVRCGDGLDPFLSRPFWIHRLRDGEAGEELALLVEVSGQGSAWLAATTPGRSVTVLGPLGKPLTPAPGVRNLLLIADGIGVAPLVWLADEEIARGRSATLLAGATTADELYPLSLLDPELELVVATADGSAGRVGGVLALTPEYTDWAEQIVGSGSEIFYRALAAMLRSRLWRRPCQVLLQEPMPCGTGICNGCAVTTRRRGTRLACRDGAAFDLRDLA
jgi:dihydroorotate dehydrogenase electron transfer subunit